MAMSLCSIYRNPLVNFKNAALGKRTVDNVHFCAKEFLQAVFHAVQGQQRNPGGEFNQQIHITVRPPLSPGQRAK